MPLGWGSHTDQSGGAVAAKMSGALGHSSVVENTAGVNGMLGADAVAKAAPDGYTLLIGTNSTNAALKSLMKKLPYDQDTAFVPVGYLGSVPLIMAVNNDVPAKTLRELVDLAPPKPGHGPFPTPSRSQLRSSEMLGTLAAHQRDQLTRLRGAVVDAVGHAGLEGDEITRRYRQVSPAGGQQLGQRVLAVERHQLITQRVVGRMQRHRQRHRAVGLQALDHRHHT